MALWNTQQVATIPREGPRYPQYGSAWLEPMKRAQVKVKEMGKNLYKVADYVFLSTLAKPWISEEKVVLNSLCALHRLPNKTWAWVPIILKTRILQFTEFPRYTIREMYSSYHSRQEEEWVRQVQTDLSISCNLLLSLVFKCKHLASSQYFPF